MTPHRYPAAAVAAVAVDWVLHGAMRIVPARHLGTPLGTAPADSRFCARADGFTVLYAAMDMETAVVETIVRDRFTHRTQRRISLVEITARGWVRIDSRPGTAVRLLDLRGDGCIRLGAPTDAVGARHHGAGRALGRAIHAQHPGVDGILFASRLTGRDIVAVYDRAAGRLLAVATGALHGHKELPGLLARHRIGLVRP
ncbi:RES family NAD+ phosphorylase [Roseospira goensis]|uniref:RES domain-containing protein n=1 Tax=Roseospira goensis TaxID=391922 RepID=A0A7W6WMK2_9PROT|nr:RES family NAD+ phosphorylase [Roseospira goensis]MBB4287848.1 hypothetical protein [Roseospira goensis]